MPFNPIPSMLIVVLILGAFGAGAVVGRDAQNHTPEPVVQLGVYVGPGKMPIRTMTHRDNTIAYSVFCDNGVEVRASYRDGIITEIMNEQMALVQCKE